jgi:hypothetical protein
MEIEVKSPAKSFEAHLCLEGNSRIIFSGIYGIGKSTFLDRFFDEKNQLDFFDNKVKYNCFHVYPVNYSVASNEDIFRLLKYDITFELIKKGARFEKIDFSYLETIFPFLKGNAYNILAPFLTLLPKIGKNLYDLTEKQKENLKTFFKQKQIDEQKTLESYLVKVHESDGNIYESDYYSSIIKDALKKLKEDNTGSQNVLILDDLDRIDPHHIFRLFNVFAAHFDSVKNSSENKFGFDKVIFVCDINNIAKIFQNRYGLNVDFNGYIDKFYSCEIHRYDNKAAIVEWLLGFFKSESYNRKTELYTARDLNFIADILVNLIDQGELNLRNLMKAKRTSFRFGKVTQRFDSGHFTKIVGFLSFVAGDSNVLIEKLTRCKENFDPEREFGERTEDAYEYLFHYLLPISDYPKHFLRHTSVEVVTNLDGYGVLKYFLVRDGRQFVASGGGQDLMLIHTFSKN